MALEIIDIIIMCGSSEVSSVIVLYLKDKKYVVKVTNEQI